LDQKKQKLILKLNISFTLQCKGLVIYHTSETAKIILLWPLWCESVCTLQSDSLWKSENHSTLHCIYGFAYGFTSQLL